MFFAVIHKNMMEKCKSEKNRVQEEYCYPATVTDIPMQLCYLIKETLICEARQPFVPLDNVPKLSRQLSHKQMN